MILYPWKFLTKESITPGKSGNLCYNTWKCHIFLSLLDILQHIQLLLSLLISSIFHTFFLVFILLTLSRLWSAMVNRTPHWRNILAWGYLKESVFFNDRPVHQIYLVKKQYGLFRLWLITICNETHLSLVAAHLY